MAPVQEIILLFTKYPRPGSSKTRLIPALGAGKAALLQRWMTQSVLRKIVELSNNYPCKMVVSHDGGSPQAMRQWLGDSLVYEKQYPGDLGERMFHAIAAHLPRSRAVLLVGSDCPSIDGTVFQEAFAALRHNQVVIGPAFDGGYYLIGVQGGLSRGDLRFLFSDITWGRPDVLACTIERIKALHLNHQLLKKLHDIDTPEDLRYFHHHPDPE
jgi:hypothetical protein